MSIQNFVVNIRSNFFCFAINMVIIVVLELTIVIIKTVGRYIHPK